MPKPTASQAAKSPMLDVARDLYLAIQCDAAKSALDECGASLRRQRIVRARAVAALMTESRVMEATLVATHGETWYQALDTASVMLAETQPLGSLAHVGDILSCSWGYDQTNVDFYQVIKISKSNVWIRQIGKKQISDHGPSVRVTAIKNAFMAPYNDGAMRRIQTYGANSYCVRISSYSHASLWDGEPCHETGWGYGH